ncbi:hypothetical protein PHYBOEH_008923 [Phytophthora boehmeriae]|uniref:CUE domain-containing protein n=1 Tax=Phytophthora boehmeriae TaxID=109152 RepID=A0A8T1X6A8_9STRA|nr:hypothetical protein PHYBOEH_008923 [Phytophthora boehmeriae]
MATLTPLLTAPDADVRAFLSSGDLQQLLPTLDDFFSRATALQTQESGNTHEASAHALQPETRAVFSLFLRLLDAPGLLQIGFNCGVLHATRLVPFCQIYARKNTRAVQELLDAVVTAVPVFSTTLGVLRQLYAQQLGDLHTSVQQAKRGQVVELVHRCYEISLSVYGMVASLPVADLMLLDGKGLEEELMLQSNSLVYGLMQCYEADLPYLQRQLATFDEMVELKEEPVIAETRHALLVALGRCVDAIMEKQMKSGSSGEELLAGLHALSNGSQDSEAEHGSYLSDLWHLCEYKNKTAAFFERCKLDQENFSYLDMVVENLPRRRILPAMLFDDLAAESKPTVALSANAKEWTAPESSTVTVAVDDETKAPLPQNDVSAPALDSLVNQVKDFIPDVGDGYVELCLLSSALQVEVVINFLLESNPPPVLIDVRKDLQRSDPEFDRLEAQITGKSASAAKVSREEPKKLDPSRVWVGKKAQEKHYDPQIAKKDQQLAEKMKQLAVMYDEEDEYGMMPNGDSYGTRHDGDDDVAALDEYDDDYNDEFEDYVPFSIRDSGNTDDQDAIREENRRMRAKEEKDAFWEGMRNRNRENPVNGAGGDDGEEEAETKAGDQSFSRINTAPDPSPAGPKQKSSRRQNTKQGAEKKSDEPPTPQQQQRMRARKDKNKAKIANHNRKDRALKKMG